MTPSLHLEGGCHCGAVRFAVELQPPLVAQDCNCSICHMTGFLHLIVPGSRFRLLGGAAELTTYTFGTGVARHLFCRVCGIKSYYVPRSNPSGFSINARCLRGLPADALVIEPFDGQHWEEHAGRLAGLSEDG